MQSKDSVSKTPNVAVSQHGTGSLQVHRIFHAMQCRIGRPYGDAQDRLLWGDKTCPART